MPNVRTQSLDGRSHQGNSREECRVTVSRHHLGGHGFRLQSQSSQGIELDFWREVSVRANGSSDLPASNLGSRRNQSSLCPFDFGKVSGKHHPKCRGLCMNAVTAANNRRADVFLGPFTERGNQQLTSFDQAITGCRQQ